MSGLYGCFLTEGTEQYVQYYEKYNKRAKSIILIAEKIIIDLEKAYPRIKGYAFLHYQNAYLAMGKYFNDVVRYKIWHNISLTHRSKIVAHMIKWLTLHPVVFCSVKENEWLSLELEERFILLHLNQTLLNAVIRYIIEPINPHISENKYDKIFSKPQLFRES